MGPENAAVAIVCLLERAGHITSAGGYLRDLTRSVLKILHHLVDGAAERMDPARHLY